MFRSIRSVALVFIAALSFLVHGLASAQIMQHHQEITRIVNLGEFTYIPIPRQNFPVLVQITVVTTPTPPSDNDAGVHSILFVVSDIPAVNKVLMTRPVHGELNPGDGQQVDSQGYVAGSGYCSDSSNLGTPYAYWVARSSGTGSRICLLPGAFERSLVVMGVTQPMPGMSNRIFVGILNSDPEFTMPAMFYISMWY